jgi:RluA family pseudouridine synthase
MPGSGSVLPLAAPATGDHFKIPVVHEDDRLLAVNKPARLLSCPDRYDRNRPNLMRMLLDGVAAGKGWARERGLTYIANVHRLDFETTGVLLLVKDREALVKLANHFGSEIPKKTYVALVCGDPSEEAFTVDASLAPDAHEPGRMRWSRHGKKSRTDFEVIERFGGTTLIACHPITGRTHQIRVHLAGAGFPIYGDELYGGPSLYLSQIKRRFKFRPSEVERPLTPTLALHAWKLSVPHPTTGAAVMIEAPWPKPLEAAVRQLRLHSGFAR